MAKRILFINQETAPYVAASELADNGRLFPELVQSRGCEIRTFMPKWGLINERRGQLHEVIRLSGLNICIAGTDHPLLIKVASIPVSRVQVYFIDNEDFFARRALTTDADGKEYADNGERAVFFARGVLETVKKLRWTPDIVVCQGWMSAVAPLYIKKVFNEEPCFADVKVVTALYDTDFQSPLCDNFKECVELKDVTKESLSDYNDSFNYVELSKMGIDYSDGVVLMGENVCPELVDYVQSKGLPCVKKTADAEFMTDSINFFDTL